jgi:imidazolonepropionase-like amidohydrolase
MEPFRSRHQDPRPTTFPAHVAALVALTLTALVGTGCQSEDERLAPADGDPAEGVVAFSAPLLWDGTGAEPISDALLVVREGRVESVGPVDEVEVPPGVQVTSLDGAFVMPGLINGHGHVGGVEGLRSSPELYSEQNILDQLGLYARYGVTTVVSLGGDGPEGVAIRDRQDRPDLDRARLYVAGPVLSPDGPDEAEAEIRRLVELGADWAKIRVDDQLGQARAMDRATYGALIREAEEHGLPLAAHVVRLEDARGLLEEGVALLAHSVRDREVDDGLVQLMREHDVCITPTLTREVSVFVYAERPDFFDDPFFLAEADASVLEGLQDPERQARVAASEAAAYYRSQLPVAMENLRRIHEGGAGVALGTDSGPPARFQGYFEHLEMEMMADAGMSPEAVLRSATGEAARCLGLDGTVGTLTPGAWADFLVLSEDPREDISNTKTLEAVWIAGGEVAR